MAEKTPSAAAATKAEKAQRKLESLVVDIMKECGYVQKDSTAPASAGGYTFATAAAVFSKVRSKMVEHGICVTGDSTLEHFSVNGKMSHAVIKATISLHLDGATLTVSAHGEGKNSGGKAVMGATTAASKYCIARLLMMSWGDDPEFEDPDEEMDQSVATWITRCEQFGLDCKKDHKAFSQWWAKFGDQVKAETTTVGASQVYEVYKGILKGMGG